MSFGKSFYNEMGRNTGKWLSNKVFGNSGWATPRRHIVEVEERKKQREEARVYKQQQKEIEQERREKERTVKQLEREEARRELEEMREANLEEVREHNNYFEVIQSVHKSYSDKMDWQQFFNQEAPKYIGTVEEHKAEIIAFTDEYIENEIKGIQEKSKLSFASKFIGGLYQSKNARLFKIFERDLVFVIITILCILGLAYGIEQEGILSYLLISLFVFLFFAAWGLKKGAKDMNNAQSLKERIEELRASREQLLNENLNNQRLAHEQYLKDKKEYQSLVDIAKGVLNKDSQSYIYALNYFKPFEDLEEYGSDISFKVDSGNKIAVDFYVHSEEVIPKTIKKALWSGKEVKEEPMPVSRFNEIYQDYVCSCILKIAKEIFQLLPEVTLVQLNAKGGILDTSTRNYLDKTIVSVLIDREKLSSLNFDLLDPSDSMDNFTHNMNFSKRNGFSVVEELE